MKTVLITGANRGLGLEFCKQYAEQGWKVIACCRDPQNAEALNKLSDNNAAFNVYKMDVVDRSGVDVLVSELITKQIDLIVANAGIYGDSSQRGFGHLDYDDWVKTLETNVLGVIKVIEAFMPHLIKSEKPHIAVLSSQMGSIDDNGSGGSLLYRSSKAALNATMKSLSIDLRSSGVGVQIFHPGWVKTDMGGPQALIDSQTSIRGMIKQISIFKMAQTGQFIKYDGSLLPW